VLLATVRQERISEAKHSEQAAACNSALRQLEESRDFCRRRKRGSVTEIPANKLLQLQWKHRSCFMEALINICVLVCGCAWPCSRAERSSLKASTAVQLMPSLGTYCALRWLVDGKHIYQLTTFIVTWTLEFESNDPDLTPHSDNYCKIYINICPFLTDSVHKILSTVYWFKKIDFSYRVYSQACLHFIDFTAKIQTYST